MAPCQRLAPLLAVATLLLSGCAGGPPTVDPSGVDGLVIPTPSPDPADFVQVVDNPYLPLRPGNEWVYEVTGDESRTITVTVSDETREVAGVTTTVVSERATSAAGEVEESSSWFAQDEAGNVWSFGTAGTWEAGVDGAQAGLVMPAMPRVGDGYRREFAAGRAEERAEVRSLQESLRLEGGSYDDLLLLEITSPLEPGSVSRVYYASGSGLVLEETVAGGSGRVELVAFTQG